VHEPDVLVSGGYSELQRTSGYRSILIVPMLRPQIPARAPIYAASQLRLASHPGVIVTKRRRLPASRDLD
jgi:hypothetical protein